MKKKTAIIIGAGPAGLTAAYELLLNTDILPVIYEESNQVGGLSKTIEYKGNRMDIGGHRFFSKSDKIMAWWQNIIPVQGEPDFNPEKTDRVMMIKKRLSRILFLGRLFDYPVRLNPNTILNLGLKRIILIGISYISAKLRPIKPEKSLEDFFINRFGKKLFLLFFKDYTEKLWGASCAKIKPEWGVQRIKGLSVTSALSHAIKVAFFKPVLINQKNIETSLIEKFLYPKFGPGQMWEEVAKIIKKRGGKIFLNYKVTSLQAGPKEIKTIRIKNKQTGEIICRTGDYFFSSMPVKDLITKFEPLPPGRVVEIANGLIYRDFITAGILAKKLKTKNGKMPDNWIYIQEKNVKLGRIQIFNNWSPYMVKNRDLSWLGLEYFCTEGDELWNKPKKEFLDLAVNELVEINLIEKKDVLDGVVIKVPKAYPAYFGSYENFSVIKNFIDNFDNLFLIGRNGMHRYNNMDHSMLTAMAAVENIQNGSHSKLNIWGINTEKIYHEKK